MSIFYDLMHATAALTYADLMQAKLLRDSFCRLVCLFSKEGGKYLCGAVARKHTASYKQELRKKVHLSGFEIVRFGVPFYKQKEKCVILININQERIQNCSL